MSASWRPGIRKEAAKYLDVPGGQNGQELLSISELVALSGDATAGVPVFEKLCQSCHVVNGTGTDFGPGLSEIGSKLSKEALYASIFKPEAGVSFGYEGYLITLTDGAKITGLIQSRTESEITVKQIGGAISSYSTDQVRSIEQLNTSLMTPNLHLLMSQKELVDLVAYLDQLETPT
jgi:putative heme-binding domain-containing protein